LDIVIAVAVFPPAIVDVDSSVFVAAAAVDVDSSVVDVNSSVFVVSSFLLMLLL
jgi:prefoldin subunit 5